MVPPASTPDDNAAFLAGCINKTRSERDVYESLGLFSQTTDLRRDPDFLKNEANELHTRVKEIAQSFAANYHNNYKQLQAELGKEGTFSEEILELGHQYGPSIWGRAEPGHSRSFKEQEKSADELDWEKPKDRETVQFYIRCWIVRLAVKDTSTTPRKRKGKGKSIISDICGGELSDSSGSSDGPNRAPENLKETFQNADAPSRTIRLNADREPEAELPSKHKPMLSPNKRKAPDVENHISASKLKKYQRRRNQSQIRSIFHSEICIRFLGHLT